MSVDNQVQLKLDAEEACEAINTTLGWRAANPEYSFRGPTSASRGGYSGGVVISRRGALELTKLLRT